MRISVSDAKGQLTDLVRRAEAGDEIILTRHGQPTVKLVAVTIAPTRAEKRKLIDSIVQAGLVKNREGPPAARSQDFLYDEDGLPK